MATILIAVSLQAQSTQGEEFWVTFGRNRNHTPDQVDLQIRIVSGGQSTKGNIYFTNLKTSIEFNIAAHQIFTHVLTFPQKQSSYNEIMGVSDYSIKIKTDNPVSVYALNQIVLSTDATNIFPITSLGIDYYSISYKPNGTYLDAYAIIATEDNTQIVQNGTPIVILKAGDVFYRTEPTDMTGVHITSNFPIAFFALCQNTNVPVGYGTQDHIMQQLAPVSTWGRNFFVPVSHCTRDIVRIVASEDGTTVTQKGGVLLFPLPPGGQPSLDNLQHGQFVDLIAHRDSAGCYIVSNKPIGVCTYLTSNTFNPGIFGSDPAQCWLPAIEQSVSNVLIAPFKPEGVTNLNAHYTLIITPTDTKNNTLVSVNGAPPVVLNGGFWRDNFASGFSFYSLQLTDVNSSYRFSNDAGLIVFCYGTGSQESYYYLGGSAMRDLNAAFYANDIHFQELKENPFCAGLVEFRAEINGLHPTHPQRIKWFVDGAMEPGTLNQETWNRIFTLGEYEIRMDVVFENDETATKIGTLKIIPCNQSAEFFANDIPSALFPNYPICNKTGKVDFRAVIEGLSQEPGSLLWYINGVKEDAADDQLTWSKIFATGTYEIKMWVRYDNGTEETITATLKVQVFWIKMQNVRH